LWRHGSPAAAGAFLWFVSLGKQRNEHILPLFLCVHEGQHRTISSYRFAAHLLADFPSYHTEIS
ncbi:MAG: hypothetical protein ACI4Q5_02355, partial [Porcipelethomonas sp.]